MLSREPVVDVLVFSTLAALAAGLGALPFAADRAPRRAWIGLAYAAAGGLMLGSGHLLMAHGLTLSAVGTTVGVAVGVGYTWLIRVYAAVDRLPADPRGRAPRAPDYGYKLLLQNALHSAAEGVAIGTGMLLSLPLGAFLATVLALHNVAEGTALTALLRRNGIRLRDAAGLCVVTNVPQPLMALAVWALQPVLADALLPGAVGFAAGSLSFLVLTESLPASYRRAGKVSIAFAVSVLAAAVVLVEDLLAGL